MKAVKISFCGEEYHLAFNGAAMFEIDEKYGGAAKLLDALDQPGQVGFKSLCAAVTLLAEQGELVRRHFGYDAGGMLSEEMISTLATPNDVIAMKQAVIKAITLGYGRDIESDDEVDLGLIELNQKKRKR